MVYFRPDAYGYSNGSKGGNTGWPHGYAYFHGTFWINGILKGKVVEIKDYLFSDLWRIYEDEESQQEGIGREQHEQREREMLENQYEELRWANRKR